MDKGVLVGYSSTRKSYKCYNLRLNKVVENINVIIDETCGQELKEEENESMEQLYDEEVYIEQPEGFKLSENIDYMCKLKKAVYGLKQAPRAWYSRMDKYLHQVGFKNGSAVNKLYIKVTQNSILLIEVYVDDIIFGSTDGRLSQKFEKDCIMNLKCHYLKNYLSLWDFRYVKATNEFLFIKPSISDK